MKCGPITANGSKTSLVSIIIVNWNGKSLLYDCFSSLDVQSYTNFEIIFVDNGSMDDSLAFVRKMYPSITTIALDSNRGFTGGNIAGYEASKGDYIVLLNNDASLCDRWLEFMVSALESDPGIGFCSSKILIGGTNLIDSAGDSFTTAFTGTKIGEHEVESNYTVKKFVPGACAAAVIYKREMLNEIGFLDDDFFLNHEDTDLNMRAWLAGWKCLFVPEAVAYHKVSTSIGALSDTSVYYFARNNEWVWLKNVPFAFMIRSLSHRILYECAFFGYFCLLKNKWKPFFRGKYAALKGAPAMLRKRKDVQALVRLSDEEINSSLVSLTDYLMKRLNNSAT